MSLTARERQKGMGQTVLRSCVEPLAVLAHNSACRQIFLAASRRIGALIVAGMALRRDETTELEAHALSLILRRPSLTAYQLRQTFAESPTRVIAMSQGTVYPLVRRLKKRGLIAAEEVAGDGRNAERLRCTPAGEGALRAWLWRSDSAIPEDPLRSKLLILDLLDFDEQRRWANEMRGQLLEVLANLEDFAEANPGPWLDLAHDNARTGLLGRIRWTERVSAALGKDNATQLRD